MFFGGEVGGKKGGGDPNTFQLGRPCIHYNKPHCRVKKVFLPPSALKYSISQPNLIFTGTAVCSLQSV